MGDYITIELEGNDVQYAAKVNGTEVADRINEIPVATTLYNGDASLQTAVAAIK